VDTTFVEIQTPHLSPWEYYNQHHNAHGFLYQVVCSLGKPFRFLSFDGPYKGSADVSIVRSTIIPKLREGERIMCDRGYHQEPLCWCPPTGPIANLSVDELRRRREVTRIRHLNERLIGRLKFWGCLAKKWNYSWSLQRLCARVAAKLTQLEVHANPLT